MLDVPMHTIIGWIGVSLIFGAYLLNSHKLIRDVPHQMLNISGALLYGIDLYVRSTWEGVCLEIAWIGIAISGLIMYVKRHHRRTWQFTYW